MRALLGGSWVVISGVISRITIIMTHMRGLRTLLITTREPPSKGLYSPRPWPKRSEVPIRIPSIPHLLIPSPLTPTPQKGHRGGGGGSLCVNP